jgi:hypothetical protein
MVWCHPDDFTVLARNDAAGLDVVIQAWPTPDGETALAVHNYRGGGEAFESVCAAVESIAAGG